MLNDVKCKRKVSCWKLERENKCYKDMHGPEFVGCGCYESTSYDIKTFEKYNIFLMHGPGFYGLSWEVRTRHATILKILI